jgi:hypothetical protein
VFLRDKSLSGPVHDALLRSWYCFPEVKQTWLGFSQFGNAGSGLGFDFAVALHENLHRLFGDFGTERVTRGSHLEKVCLIREGVGRDNISDFTTNLIKEYLCNYSQAFALAHLSEVQRRRVAINNVRFSYSTERWQPDRFVLPWINGDYVILTPKDMLTKDDTWINKNDLIRDFDEIPDAIPDAQLRMQVSNYFERVLPRHREREPNRRERADAARLTILQFPSLIDYYIRFKEDHGDEAENISHAKIFQTEQFFIFRLQELQEQLNQQTPFYKTGRTTYEEAHARLMYLKDVIENKGGHRFFCSCRWRSRCRSSRSRTCRSRSPIEQLVTSRVRQWLLDPGSIYKATSMWFPNPSTQRQIAARAEEIGNRWPELPATRRPAVLAALIERIDVGVDQIDIHLRSLRLIALLDVSAMPLQSVTDDETQILSVPVRVRRAGREIKMLIDGTDPFAATKPRVPGEACRSEDRDGQSTRRAPHWWR